MSSSRVCGRCGRRVQDRWLEGTDDQVAVETSSYWLPAGDLPVGRLFVGLYGELVRPAEISVTSPRERGPFLRAHSDHCGKPRVRNRPGRRLR